MSGTINSLGIGSGVLTSDVIEQLRASDEARIVTPLENKVTLQNQKEEAFKLIDSLLSTFKSSVSALGDGDLYQKRIVDISGGDLEVKAETGAAVESFSLRTVALAKQNIQQSGTFGSRSDSVATGSGTMTLDIGSSSYSIDYTATTTLEELTQSINDEAGSDVTATILQTGASTFSLVLTSKETGLNQAISLSDTPDVAGDGLVDELYNDATVTSGFTSAQDAKDSEFVYNGITITRSSNEVDDLINGVTLTLKTEGETAGVDIVQDTFSISTEMQLLADSYNALQANLNDVTVSDREAGTVGVFSGDAFMNSIIREINSIVISTDGNNNSLLNYGIDVSRNGTMSFNQAEFDTEFAKDPAATELFFTGGTNPSTGNSVTGLFESLDDKLYTFTKFNGLFDNFEQGLKTATKNLNEEHSTAVARLDSRYEILTKQFIAYDAMISKLNSQFASLQLQIQAQANGSNN